MDLIDRQVAVDAIQQHREDVLGGYEYDEGVAFVYAAAHNHIIDVIKHLPSTQPEIIYCRECKHWRQQTNYAGAPLSFGFCESDDMWRSLYGETYEVSHIDTDDDFYCGFAERI
jgi:hypothetical protein